MSSVVLGWVRQLELEFDLISGAGPRPEPRSARERARGAVVPQRRRGQNVDAVLAGASNESLGEHQANSVPLQVVCDLDRDVCRTCSLGPPDVASHANDRAVSAVDSSERLMANVINVGEVRELAVAQFRLPGEQAPETRLGTQPREQRAKRLAVADAKGPEREPCAGGRLRHSGSRRLMTFGRNRLCVCV
jgi:hypothetical protein